MKNIFSNYNLGIVISAVVLASILGSKPAIAQYYDQSGGGPSITVDKKIRPINDSSFSDNIDPKVKVFGDGEQVEFKITVFNNSNQVLYNVELKDILPKYLTLLFYPGVFNKTDNVVFTVIDQLNAGESKDFYIRANISNVPTTNLAVKNILQTNKACASNNLVSDCDEVDYFISGKNIPSTGADDLLIKTVSVLLISMSAVGLRKVARGY